MAHRSADAIAEWMKVCVKPYEGEAKTVEDWSDELKWSVARVRTLFKALKKLGRLKVETNLREAMDGRMRAHQFYEILPEKRGKK